MVVLVMTAVAMVAVVIRYNSINFCSVLLFVDVVVVMV